MKRTDEPDQVIRAKEPNAFRVGAALGVGGPSDVERAIDPSWSPLLATSGLIRGRSVVPFAEHRRP